MWFKKKTEETEQPKAEEIEVKKTTKLTNCVNCGAALHSDVCEYCGTDYTACDENGISRTFDCVDDLSKNGFVKIKISGKEYEVYVGDLKITLLSAVANVARDECGALCKKELKQTHIFNVTFIER